MAATFLEHRAYVLAVVAALVLAILDVPSPASAERPSKTGRFQSLQESSSVLSSAAALELAPTTRLSAGRGHAAAASNSKAGSGEEDDAAREDDSFSAADDDDADEEARLRRLLAWAQKQRIRGAANVEVQKLPPWQATARRSRSNAKLVLRRDVPAGTTVLSVPPGLLLWSHGLQTEAMFRKAGVPDAVLSMEMSRYNSSGEARLRLAAGVLALKAAQNATESWPDYFGSLPSLEEFRATHPSTARPQLCEKFKQLPVTLQLKGQQQRRQGRWQEFLRRGGHCTSKAWNWAELAVLTRSWGGPGGVGSILAPVADAVRAGPPGRSNLLVTYGNPDQGASFVLTALRHIAAGEELLVDYGRMPDDVFMPIWGYTPGHYAPTRRLAAAECALLGNASGLDLEANPSANGSLSSVQVSSWRRWPLVRFQKSLPVPGAAACQPPSNEPQKGAFCALAALAAEQCGIGGPLQEAAVERMPFYRHPIVIGMFVLGLSTIVARLSLHNLNSMSVRSRTPFTSRGGSGAVQKQVLTARTARRRL